MFAIKIYIFFCHSGDSYARCTYCASDFNITHGGGNDVTTHVRGKHHKEMAEVTSSTRSIASYYRPQTLQSVIEAESTIPVSNTDCERGFSVLRKIHTDQRPTLKQSTIISLMAIKFNSGYSY